MEEEIGCVYCGGQNNPLRSHCSSCQQPLAGDIDNKLLTKAFNAPVIFENLATGCLFYALLFLGLLGTVSGFFRFNDFKQSGLGYIAILWIISGLMMIISLIGLRIKSNLTFCILFAIGSAIQGFTLVFTQKFMSNDFLGGILLLIMSGLAFWDVYEFSKARKIPEPILSHAESMRKLIFIANVDDEPGLLKIQDMKGNVTRVLMNNHIVILASDPKKDVRVVHRNMFEIVKKDSLPASESKTYTKIENKEAEIRISPKYWEKYQAFVNNN